MKSKFPLLLELVIVGSTFWIIREVVTINYSSQIALVVSLILATFLMKRRGISWHQLGVKRSENWLKAIGLFVLCVATIALTFNFIIQPLFPTGANEVSGGNPISIQMLLFQLIVIGIGCAAIGEELMFRGYLLNTFETIIGSKWVGTLVAVLLQAFIFGILHSGLQGMVSAGVIGLILGGYYLLGKRNLIIVMAAHAVPDILSIIGSYQSQ